MKRADLGMRVSVLCIATWPDEAHGRRIVEL
jgi:hypothetical protein